MIAGRQTAARKFCSRRSYLVATRRKSLIEACDRCIAACKINFPLETLAGKSLRHLNTLPSGHLEIKEDYGWIECFKDGLQFPIRSGALHLETLVTGDARDVVAEIRIIIDDQ